VKELRGDVKESVKKIIGYKKKQAARKLWVTAEMINKWRKG
jgi:hypothetical protein